MTLLAEIKSRNLEEFVNELYFERVPFIFNSDVTLYRSWKKKLSGLLQIDPHEMIFVGSSALGVSLNPKHLGRRFSESSDIDIAIISEHHFSVAWHNLRTINMYDQRLTADQRFDINEHKSKYIYYGCIATDRILPILPFNIEWMSARSEMGKIPPTEGRDINFRVYKDFRALRGYHISGLKILKRILEEE